MPKLLARQLQFRLGEHHMAYQPAIPLEGTFLTCSETEIPDFFQDYNYMCPACNVQLIFYRADGKAPVLVKFLLNEKETLIHGLKPLTGCYYEWSKVKEFWANR